METMEFMYDLANSKAALEAANHAVRKLKAKCIRKNILIAGLLWFGLTTCKMLGESDKKLQAAENEARGIKAELAHMQQSYDQLFEETQHPKETDVCCDGKATITKKDV